MICPFVLVFLVYGGESGHHQLCCCVGIILVVLGGQQHFLESKTVKSCISCRVHKMIKHRWNDFDPGCFKVRSRKSYRTIDFFILFYHPALITVSSWTITRYVIHNTTVLGLYFKAHFNEDDTVVYVRLPCNPDSNS